MNISYDMMAGAFLEKISEFEFMKLQEADRDSIVVGLLKRAISEFRKNCKYKLSGAWDDEHQEFVVDIRAEDIDELIDIISEGMVVQWLKPYVYSQENLQNALNTRDYTLYSPAELLKRVSDVYERTRSAYTQMIREYSYNHGDLTRLHI